MWRDLLAAVIKQTKEFDFEPQPPCAELEITKLCKRAEAKLGTALPKEYLDLLREVNGLNWNGLFIYASRPTPLRADPESTLDGVVEINLQYCIDDYVVLGQGNTDFYSYHIPTSSFHVASNPSLIVVENYPDCGSLLSSALRSALL
jgi:hypothetical protein